MSILAFLALMALGLCIPFAYKLGKAAAEHNAAVRYLTSDERWRA